MRFLLFFVGLWAVSTAEPGHYKIRPPLPPMMPPGPIHFGPQPPIHRSPYQYIHPHRPPHFPPKGSYVSGHVSRMPSPYFPKNTIRDYPRPPIFGPPPKAKINYNHWKNLYHPNAFRAPVVKETFNPPPSSYTPTLIRDDDKGPIHTIPAPDLSLVEKPHHTKAQDPEDDLIAVLRHGINNVNVRTPPSYQVTEDPSIHTPAKGEPPFYAPDPDPHTPTLKVPATKDPYSIPSNGQVPLDLYLQQEAEKQQEQLQKQPVTDSSNTLTAQDLFNLLNYQQGEPAVVAPLYTQTALFTPQFQTFNYDEQTQQGAYGSNIFPEASMAVHVSDINSAADHQLQDLKSFSDNEIAGSEVKEVFRRHNDIDGPQKNKSVQKTEVVVGKDEYRPQKVTKNTQNEPEFKITVPSNTKSPTTTTIEPSPPVVTNETIEPAGITQSPSSNAPVKNDENFQLQKSIQIYESSSYEDQLTGSNKPTFDVELRKDLLEDVRSAQAQTAPSQSSESLPFGARIRPKRF